MKKLDERAGSDKWALARLADIHAESKKSTGSDKVVTGVKRKRGDHGDGTDLIKIKIFIQVIF